MLGIFTSAKTLLQQRTLQATRNASYLGNLEAFSGAVKAYKRVGRGPASGKGKTAGRGQKGQKARGKVPLWLEGGQTPYYKRFPITGFARPHKKEYHEVNLVRIQQMWNEGRIPLQEGETLTIKVMRECGVITGALKDGVRLLGKGASNYNVPLNVETSQASATAIDAIRKTGFSYTAVYFTELSLQAHVYPDRFLLKKGYVPLPARPLHKRDIAYYSNPDKGGYLLKDRSLLLDHMGARTQQRKTRSSTMDVLLLTASTKSYSDYAQCQTVSLADLNL